MATDTKQLVQQSVAFFTFTCIFFVTFSVQHATSLVLSWLVHRIICSASRIRAQSVVTLPSLLLLSSSTRKEISTPTPSPGQAVVTGVFPPPPCTRLHFCCDKGSTIPTFHFSYAHRFSSIFASSRSRAFRSSILTRRKSPYDQ